MEDDRRRRPSIAVVVLLLCLPMRCTAHFNLYLDNHEVMRLLGLTAELYYVRDGLVNDYALNFVLVVPAPVGELHFTWQSLAGRPLPYSIAVELSDRVAIAATPLNVSRTGSVPTGAQTFRVAVPCSGQVPAEVDVLISLNVTLGRTPADVTRLLLRRRKVCLPAPLEMPGVAVAPEPTASSADIFYVAAGCALTVVAAAALLASCCLARGDKTRRNGADAARTVDTADVTRAHKAFLAPESATPHAALTGTSGSSCKSAGSCTSRRTPACSAVDERSKDLHERIAELTIQRCRVRLRSVVQEGTFGRVYVGSYAEDAREQEVLVKTVAEHASHVQVSLLLQEGLALYGLRHRHVLGVLGVSIEDHTAPFLVYPHGGRSNLKRFLQCCRSTEGAARALTTHELVGMALQAARALHFLHRQGLVHRDVAARNCAVDERLHVQVADTALARDLFPADYHCLGDNENRPVKWLAAEALQRRIFSAASDAWSFGVLLWELATLAQQPYAEVDPSEVAAYLRDGYRLAQPVNCPDELFAVMAYCWAMTPEERPSFPQLQTFLQDFHAQLTRYV